MPETLLMTPHNAYTERWHGYPLTEYTYAESLPPSGITN